MASARLLESHTHIIPGKLKVTELLFEVPKDYSSPSSGAIQVFARSVSRHENPISATGEEFRTKSEKPWFVYLQGGPGFPCSAPQNMPITDFILDKGYRILFLDQRGTGLSTPISAATLALQGDIHKQADYLKLFRADSIVNDCEVLRELLTKGYPAELKKWTVFGQSFGGFCVLTYLSQHPDGLHEAFTSGGLPPIGQTAEQVYRATYQKVIQRNKEYYKKFPEDVDIIHGLAFHIKSKGGLSLPSGGSLTVRALLSLGRGFGMHGGLDSVHDFVLRMKTDLAQFQFITRPTLSAIETALSFDNAVLYAVLHEPIYCQGVASNWAADRVGKSIKEFQWLSDSPQPASVVRENPLYFSGEMVFPFHFEVFPELEKLAPVADILAKYSGWPRLYDECQLARNEVPLYSATFVDDMYVDFGLAQETAKLVKNCVQNVTNTMYHDAVRSKTQDLMEALFALRDHPMD